MPVIDRLAALRHQHGYNPSQLAALAGVAPSTITRIEAGERTPAVDVAERTFSALGATLTVLSRPAPGAVYLANRALRTIRAAKVDPSWSRYHAAREAASILENEAATEGWGISFSDANELLNDRTIAGGLGATRASRAKRQLAGLIRSFTTAEVPTLTYATGDLIVESDTTSPMPDQAMRFLVEATHAGADPSTIRMLTGCALAHHGYPWLTVPHGRDRDYERALDALLRGDGTTMVELLAESIPTDWTDG